MGSVSLKVRGLRKLRAQFICLEGHIAETVELNDTLFFFFFFLKCAGIVKHGLILNIQ